MTSRGDMAEFTLEFESYRSEQTAAQLIINIAGSNADIKPILSFKIELLNVETGLAQVFFNTKKSWENPPVRILCEYIEYSVEVLVLKGINENGQGLTIEIVF